MAVSVGIVFVAFFDIATAAKVIYQDHGAVKMVMNVEFREDSPGIGVHYYDLINIIAVSKPHLWLIGAIIFAQYLPFIVVIIPPGVVGVNKVFFLNPPAK